MFQTLKLFYRSFRKNLTINLINLGGLTFSIAIALILLAYCYSELSTDRHHSDVNRKYLIGSSTDMNAYEIVTPGVLSTHVQESIPDIEKVVRIAGTWNTPLVKSEGVKSFETNLMYADDGFFNMFSYAAASGQLSTSLTDPFSAVLSKHEAIKLFGSTDVIGENIIINNQYNLTVTAVLEENKDNSILDFDILIPLSSVSKIPLIDDDFDNWHNWFVMTFVQTKEGANTENTASKVKSLFNANRSKESESAPEIRLMPLCDIYFSEIDNSWLDFLKVGNKTRVYILAMVSLLIFAMAIINFFNISSYGLTERMHLSGLFKIVGANRNQILKYSILETAIIFMLISWLAIILAEILRPVIQQYTGLQYSNHILLLPGFIATFVVLTSLFGILSNLVNSLKVSGASPANSIRKKSIAGKQSGSSQGMLVVIQFYATILLISFTVLINKQIKFGSKGLGYNEESILEIKTSNTGIKEKLAGLAKVEMISFTSFYPGRPVSSWGANVKINGEDKYLQFEVCEADPNFTKILGLDVIFGRSFSDKITTDKNKVLINEAFVRAKNIDNPIGVTINDKYEVIGVVKDFHFRSKNFPISPLVILNRGYGSYFLVKVYSGNFADLSATVDDIREICAGVLPDSPVEVSFMDVAVEQMYQSEIRFRKIFTFFSASAILISCLGILALSLFASQRRTKEIGIRKVNGAYTGDILRLLNKDFTKWVLIAFILAIPTGYFAMNKWLQQFAHKTEISWWIFALGGASALTIALLTVSWQSWKAARRNPVEALRYE